MSFPSNISESRTTDNSLILGTCMFNTLGLGQIKSSEVDKKVTITEIQNTEGGLRALLLKNPQTTMTLEIILESGQTVPGPTEHISIPDAELEGIIESVKFKYKEGEIALYDVVVKGWDNLGLFTMYRWNGTGAGSWTMDYTLD